MRRNRNWGNPISQHVSELLHPYQHTGGSVLYNQGGATPSSHFLIGEGARSGNSFFGTTTNLAVNGAQGATTIRSPARRGSRSGRLFSSMNIQIWGGNRAGFHGLREARKLGASDYRMNWLAQDPLAARQTSSVLADRQRRPYLATLAGMVLTAAITSMKSSGSVDRRGSMPRNGLHHHLRRPAHDFLSNG